MPIYEYICPRHGKFSVRVTQYQPHARAMCAQCEQMVEKVLSRTGRPIIRNTVQQPYGNGSPGRYLTSEETGGMPVFILSWGAMEQAEVDEVALASIEREQERVKKAQPRETAKAIGNLVAEADKAPPGKRFSTMQEVKKEGM